MKSYLKIKILELLIPPILVTTVYVKDISESMLYYLTIYLLTMSVVILYIFFNRKNIEQIRKINEKNKEAIEAITNLSFIYVFCSVLYVMVYTEKNIVPFILATLVYALIVFIVTTILKKINFFNKDEELI